MPFNVFLEFVSPSSVPAAAQVVGESQDKIHPNTVEVTSFTLGVENTSTIGSATGGAGAGKAMFSSLEITKQIDKASPGLFALAASGGHFDQANLYVRKVGGTTDYLVYRLKLVAVSDVEWSGASGDDSPLETVKFQYGALQVQYASQNANGTLATPQTANWSQVLNQSQFSVPGVP